MSLVPGQSVPDFCAVSTHGDFSLAARQGKKVVLYFYPKDDTSGCTAESVAFRDLHQAFCMAGAEIVGISRDSLKSHEKFSTKFDLPFALISDKEEVLCTLFDVIKPKKMYGKDVRGIERSTFLIDEKGVLQHEWRGVKVPGHAHAVLDMLQQVTP